MKGSAVKRGILGLAAVFAAVSAASAIAVPRIPAVAAGSRVSAGNRYLNELDYEQALAKFEQALEIEPKDAEAIRGIVEAAYHMGDRDVAEKYICYYWETALEDDTFYEKNEEELEDVTRGARLLYQEPTAYMAFLEKLRDGMGEEKFRKLAMEAAAAFILEGRYDAAGELMGILYGAVGDPGNQGELKRLYEICAEKAWKEHDYDRALNILEEALKRTGKDSRLSDELLRVAQDSVTACISSQQYTKAEEIIERVQKLRKDDSLAAYAAETARMREADARLQRLIEQLNTAFDADDAAAIEGIMNGQEFAGCAEKVRRVLYSSSLWQSGISEDGGMPEGLGTAIYMIDGRPYVYYGEYREGKRQGMGRWYYSTGEGYLAKYTVNWENDLPNGRGRIDKYGILTHWNQSGDKTGEDRTRDDVEFFCVNGIMDGPYTNHGTVLSDDSYRYDLTVNLTDGYAVPLKDGDYPSQIDLYHKYRTKIAAYDIVERHDEQMGSDYESYVWEDYSTELYTVAGFENCVTGVTPGEADLVLQ